MTALLNMRQAARALGVSTWVLSGLKRAAQSDASNPFVGRYTTLERLEAWFNAHPNFVASHHLRDTYKSRVIKADA